jgi:hypothetical protein
MCFAIVVEDYCFNFAGRLLLTLARLLLIVVVDASADYQ